MENLAGTVIRSPDRPVGSDSLYRLNYPAPELIVRNINKFKSVMADKISSLSIKKMGAEVALSVQTQWARVLGDGNTAGVIYFHVI